MNPLVLTLFALLAADPRAPCVMRPAQMPDGAKGWAFLCVSPGPPPDAPDHAPTALAPFFDDSGAAPAPHPDDSDRQPEPPAPHDAEGDGRIRIMGVPQPVNPVPAPRNPFAS